MIAGQENNETVILLHGIGHSLWNMAAMEKALKKEGYDTLNLSYPSRKHKIVELASWLHKRLEEEAVWDKASRVHFVAHSMGGLVTQYYLEHHKESIVPEKMGRVVMMGTPHGGSEVADLLQDNLVYRWVFGPAGQELTTTIRQAEKNKIDLYYDLGIIAGTQRWMYPLGLYAIKEDHDGCVSVESTKREGMKDHLVMSVLHGFMGWDKNVQRQAIHFIKKGAFKK